MYVYLPNVGVVVMGFHVVIEVGLGAVQLPAHLAGMLPQQEYAVLRRHVPDPVLGHGAAEVAYEIWQQMDAHNV